LRFVRNCLQRTPAPANSPVSDPVKPPIFDQNAIRQAAPVSHTYIDGAALGQIAAQARVSSVINQNPGSSRKNVDPNGYQRRYGLLQRQKQQNPNSLNKNGSAQRQIRAFLVQSISYTLPRRRLTNRWLLIKSILYKFLFLRIYYGRGDSVI
jgi:hypothetical protein